MSSTPGHLGSCEFIFFSEDIMSECCEVKTFGEQAPRSLTCPLSRKVCLEVPFNTVLQHIKSPWRLALPQQAYYFCDDPNCELVYFSRDGNTRIHQSQMRTTVGVKETSPDATLCYCFGVSRSQAIIKEAKEFVISQTKAARCNCSSRNPSGRCCLKDFPK